MDIRSSMDGLKSLLGVTPPATTATQNSNHAAQPNSTSGLGSDRATLSSAGSEVSLAASDSGIRTDKVAAVQAALAAGSYNVPASAVASKMVDAMLGNSR